MKKYDQSLFENEISKVEVIFLELGAHRMSEFFGVKNFKNRISSEYTETAIQPLPVHTSAIQSGFSAVFCRKISTAFSTSISVSGLGISTEGVT